MKWLLLLFLAISLACPLFAGTVTDIDGNVYQTVTIGTQEWMAANLKVTHYRNGDDIPNVTDNATWEALNTGAYCEYNNDANNVATYGRLYSGYAVGDSRNIAPTGWHIPSDAEWQTLVDYLGGISVAGGKMKEAGTMHWYSPNIGATNESGFSGLPCGYRSYDGPYGRIGYSAYFWSSTELSISEAWYRYLDYNGSGVYRGSSGKRFGYSVRCVNDITVGIDEHGGAEHPDAFNLTQNYPNPFNPVTTIEYSVPTRTDITIEIFIVLGQKVRTLVDESKSAGEYRIEWSGSDDAGRPVSTGVYLYRFSAGDVVQTKKMLLLK